jgi:pimeloyl-ACP methyl ester carboxylesterase
LIQIVFVHGVATRDGGINPRRDQRLRKAFAHFGGLAIDAPYWGDEVPELPPELFEAKRVRARKSSVDLTALAASGSFATALVKAAKRNVTAARHELLDQVVDLFRPGVALFLGDALAYVGGGETRRKIRTRVAASLSKALEAKRRNGDKVVLIGHSMGGVILTDLLYDPATAIANDIPIDALVTVGSQPSLFQQ